MPYHASVTLLTKLVFIMNIGEEQNQQTAAERIEYYAFMWSMARMALAAIALLLGGMPLAVYVSQLIDASFAYEIVRPLLSLSWILSGLAALYLLYRWSLNEYRIFNSTDRNKRIAIIVLIVSGINLSLTPILSKNIGISIAFGAPFYQLILYAGAAVYLWVLFSLWTAWKKHDTLPFIKTQGVGFENVGVHTSSSESKVNSIDFARYMLGTVAVLAAGAGVFLLGALLSIGAGPMLGSSILYLALIVFAFFLLLWISALFVIKHVASRLGMSVNELTQKKVFIAALKVVAVIVVLGFIF